METLQGLSATALSSSAGRKWRTAYSDPANTERVGLDDTVWPEAFDRMEQFIQDTHLTAEDLNNNYDTVTELFQTGQPAMYFGSSAGVSLFREEGIDTVFLPFFGENGEKWLMTMPYFQVALNRELEQDEARRETAMRVLKVMLSAETRNIVCDGQDTLSCSQNVPLRFSDALQEVRPVVEENHMYIRITSNDFFSVSQDVVSKRRPRPPASRFPVQAHQHRGADRRAQQPSCRVSAVPPIVPPGVDKRRTSRKKCGTGLTCAASSDLFSELFCIFVSQISLTPNP